MDELALCPCGKIPESLGISNEHESHFFSCYPLCCSVWSVGFDNPFGHDKDSIECMAMAVAAWNEATRGAR